MKKYWRTNCKALDLEATYQKEKGKYQNQIAKIVWL